MKPIHKFNGGLGATLCHSCSVIISIGLTEDLYCEKCKPKQEPNYNMKQEILAEMERLEEEPKQETLEEAAVIYAHKSFVWPLNKQGEKQSIPPGQVVPPGYAKHQKIATKHFTSGAKWQQEQFKNESTADYIDRHIVEALVKTAKQENKYSEEEMIDLLYKRDLYLLNRNKEIELELPDDWFEQFKKK